MKNNLSKLSLSIKMGLAASAALSMTFAMPTMAQEAAVDNANVEKIAVVGSRGAPRSVGDSPVPVDIIGGDELSKNASTDMLDMLVAAVPSFNVRAQPISDAASLIRPVNLRGLSSDSTLILLNGKRRHRASVIAFQGGGVNDGAQGPDISVIPSVALKQVEVLRDGAAAQYGSDAIAGVMNFVLKDASEGGSISIRQGSYYEGDGDSTVIDGNIGLPFTSDGFANFSFQLKNADATSRSVQRPDAQALFDAGNTEIKNPAQIWGNPEIEDDITLFGNIGLDLGDDKEFYLFGNYSERDVTGGFYYRNPHNRGNVYSVDGGETLLVGAVNGDQSSCAVVPANVPNVLDTQEYMDMVADPNCFSMNMVPGFAGGYTPQFGGNITDTSLTMGTKGEIKSGFLADWFFDLSGSVGRSESRFNLKNTLNPSLGLDTPTEFETGAYIQLEKTFNFDLVKEIEVGGAPLNLATGLEWREESFEIVAGEQSSWEAGPYADQGFNIGSHGFKGFGPESAGVNTRRNMGAYVDIESYVTEDFLLGAALRYEDFSSFGDTLDYKLTAQYVVNDTLSLRGSHSTGFRAPTVGQANVVNTQTSIVNGDLIQTFIAPPTDPLSSFYGGKELTPEESTSFAFGAVVETGDVFFTIDYYNIEVTDRIAQSSQITVEAEDYAELRSLGVQNPELISAVTYYANDFDTTTQGLDIVANYSLNLFEGDTTLSLAYNWNETSVDSFNPETTDEGKVRRLERGMPDHRATFTFSQSWDDVSMFVRANYFGEYYATHADDTSEWGSEIADSAVTIDVEVSYYINDSFTISAGANNLFDQEAQKLKDGTLGELGAVYYESGPFDYNGGYYYLQGKYSF
ncbi:TonB-dependent receptor plug domain-containing protein [Aliiglaciecola lipolytica]|uniref:Iron complex outermembrane recepter protein n=1 Tax=Aliiglaciecola lipolytica E3 TaxID=1127673 RepID=K6YNZ5_9ALTE|nr:TonB-dependent receptor [Aliiglaciecola lipolytica]GAC13070.1 iron complex outermembrane recepter protein [Aliiglaciecola lipolytica E3]